MKKLIWIAALLFAGLSVSAANLPINSQGRDTAANDFASSWRLSDQLVGQPASIRLTTFAPRQDPQLFEVEVHSELGSQYFEASHPGNFVFEVEAGVIGENTTIVVFDQNHASRCGAPSNCTPKVVYEYALEVAQATPAKEMLDCSQALWLVPAVDGSARIDIVDAHYPINPYTACQVDQTGDLSTTLIGTESVRAHFPEGTTEVNFNLAAYYVTAPLDPLSDYQGNIQVFLKDAANPWGWNYAGQVDLFYNSPANGGLHTVALDEFLSNLVLAGPIDIKLVFSSRFEDSSILFDALSFTAR